MQGNKHAQCQPFPTAGAEFRYIDIHAPAAGYSAAQAVFNGWKASSGHNKNMLNPNFKVIGIGFATVSTAPYKYYWTTDFGGKVDAAGC